MTADKDEELVEQMRRNREATRATPEYAAARAAHKQRMLDDPAYAEHVRKRTEYFSGEWSNSHNKDNEQEA